MSRAVSDKEIASVSVVGARVTIAAAGAVVLLLASLHLLSPEFDPSWRVVSEYANGRYGWVLSLMFASWALSSWALAVTAWSEIKSISGRVGLGFLIASGMGEAMASVFDINHPLHGLAGLLGAPSLPIAAILISVSLARTEAWSSGRSVLLWTANLTWVSLLLLAGSLIVTIQKHTRTALVGWANRLLVVVYCLWLASVASHALQRRRPSG
jgi:hypothetical protein